MAIIKCPECKKEISNSAKTCPNCGLDLEKYNKEKFSFKGCCLMFAAIIALLFIIGGISKGCENKTSQPPQKVEVVKKKTEQEIQDSLDNACFEDVTPYRIHSAIMDQLNDPDSYEFINYKRAPKKGDSILVLVQFTAKNGFGGIIRGSASYYTKPPKKGMVKDYANKDWCPILHLNIYE